MPTLSKHASAYRFAFNADIDMNEVQETLALTVMGAESIHGQSQVQLDARCEVDAAKRAVLIETDSAVGRDVAKLFIGFAAKQFSGLRVERITRGAATLPGEAP